MSEKRILLMGVGNTLYKDEGLGVHAVNYLDENYVFSPNVTLMDGGTMGKLLMYPLMEHDTALLIDAVLGGEAPGTVYRLVDDALRKSLGFHDSQHQVDLVDTLVSCEIMGKRPEAVVIGMEPEDYRNMGIEMTDRCREKMPKLIAHVLEELEAMGGKATPKERE